MCVSLRSLNLDKQTVKGSTALHYCCLTDNSECLKLLLRGKASIDIGKKLKRKTEIFCVTSAYDMILQEGQFQFGGI